MASTRPPPRRRVVGGGTNNSSSSGSPSLSSLSHFLPSSSATSLSSFGSDKDHHTKQKRERTFPLLVGGAIFLFALVALAGSLHQVSRLDASPSGRLPRSGLVVGDLPMVQGYPGAGGDGSGGGEGTGEVGGQDGNDGRHSPMDRRRAAEEMVAAGAGAGAGAASKNLRPMDKSKAAKGNDDDDDGFEKGGGGGWEGANDNAAVMKGKDEDDEDDDNVAAGAGGGGSRDRDNAASEDAALQGPVHHNRSKKNPSPGPNVRYPEMTEPFWHLGDDPDDAVYDRVYMGKDKLHSLRDIPQNMKNAFSPMCSYYRFDETKLPTVSVIVTSQNERTGLNSITVHSILARTPPDLLKEIIVVDDNSADPEYREFVDEDELIELENFHPKVKLIRNTYQEGCARSRLAGARAATGEVLMFVDSHVEMLSSTWYHHIVLPIMENPHTMAVQTIEVMSDDPGMNWTYSHGGGVSYQYGIISEKFLFGYQYKRFHDIDEEQPNSREPYETPFVPGSLFAMRADEFWRLGGYDRGLYVWGGENTELALKTWMCGGRVVMVPCSRVGHVYRVKTVTKGKGQWPPKMDPELLSNLGASKPGQWLVHHGRADPVTRVVTRNNLRIMNIWVGDHPARNGYYLKSFGTTDLAPEWKQYVDELSTDEAALEQIEIKERNKCHDFEWFDLQVYKRLLGKHHPWHPSNPQTVNCGGHTAKSCRECPQGHGRSFCNGECSWCPELGSAGLCVNATDIQACPSHKAKTVKKALQKQNELDEEHHHHQLQVPKQAEANHPPDRWEHLVHQKNARFDALRAARGLGGHGDEGSGEISIVAADKGAGAGGRGAVFWPPVFPEDNPMNMSLSVVLPCGFEHEYFVRTARSVFLSTPPSVLKEIVIVDDASDPPLEPLFDRAFERGDVDNGGGMERLGKAELDELRSKVKFVRHKEAMGLIGAKQSGAEAASGDVLVFFDCHVKPDRNYWKAFTRKIGENYRRVVVPTITNLNTDTWEEFGRPNSPSGGGMSKCYLTFDAEFKWTRDDTDHVPIMSGGLLAMSRKWFFEVGGYDKKMHGWGGENLDQSLRIWRCGGEIVSADDSFVAHMWRDAQHMAKYRLNPGDSVLNRARAVKAHVGPWFEKTLTFPSFAQYRSDGGESLDVSSITDGMKDLECRSFEWYLSRFGHIYRDAGVLPTKVFQLEAVLDEDGNDGGSPQCLQLEGHNQWNNAAAPNDATKLAPCVGVEGSKATDGTQWWHKSNRNGDGECCSGLRVWNTDQCLNANGVTTGVCSLTDDNPAYMTKSGKLRVGGLCLSVDGTNNKLRAIECDKAIKWRKRSSFEPVEFSLLSESIQSEWKSSPKKGSQINDSEGNIAAEE